MKPINIRGKNINHVYFIGIGGSSMSGLAIMLKNSGYKVSGSDQNASDKTAKLERMGIGVKIGHSAENLDPTVDLVVFTAAIAQDNPELIKSKELGLAVV